MVELFKLRDHVYTARFDDYKWDTENFFELMASRQPMLMQKEDRGGTSHDVNSSGALDPHVPHTPAVVA